MTGFDPPKVTLAFETRLLGEVALTTIFTDPLPSVVVCLLSNKTVSALRDALPDKMHNNGIGIGAQLPGRPSHTT